MIIHELALSAANKAVTSELLRRVRGAIVERWSNYRAEQFFATLVEEYRKQQHVLGQSAGLDQLLRKIDIDDSLSSQLFDSYRAASLSASKRLGPRIIGVVTAEITLAGRAPSPEEELLFQAAEHLNDLDLTSVADFVNRSAENQPGRGKPTGFNRRAEVSVWNARLDFWNEAPPNLGSELGVWALKVMNLGLMWQTLEPVVDELSRLTSSTGEAEPAAQIVALYSPTCEKLVSIINRVAAADYGSAT